MTKILVITPLDGIDGVVSKLESVKSASVEYLPNAREEDLKSNCDTTIIFTNPNRTNIFLGERALKNLPQLKIIVTASTGTVHIDKEYCEMHGISIISLAKEYHVINSITGTAEHALCLTLMGVRKAATASSSVISGEWDCENYIGHQFNKLTVGVIGYGRLGSLYASYCDALGATVYVFDPYKNVAHPRIRQVSSLNDLIAMSNVISLHVHVTDDTSEMINSNTLSYSNELYCIINTSRGEVVDEHAIIDYLQKTPGCIYASDVISNESCKETNNSIILKESALGNQQLIVTPHIGGMTKEGRHLAYNHAVDLLLEYLDSKVDLK